jgi:hypothetical protein
VSPLKNQVLNGSQRFFKKKGYIINILGLLENGQLWGGHFWSMGESDLRIDEAFVMLPLALSISFLESKR